MDFEFIFMFLGISLLSSLWCRNAAMGILKEYGAYSPSYHKRYTVPARWVRSLFKIKQRYIPRYLYFELILSLFFAVLGPINLIICVIVDYNPNIVGILVMLHICLSILNVVFFSIFSFRLKKQGIHKRRKQKHKE